ncbi:hypothetical protein [Uliginosibacterium sp. 31-12]|uniref:hypothetical protein n=1 Tax=Uliginosibacterium sp. 31-12 TaxID=3062781 RepID=UPI0026E38F4F|nr:hypothetical protein [Uliginosibacterium sp. 31-12]MDO6386727.1 hypothetical protein [Uliginosibacterium sp. 31-12]
MKKTLTPLLLALSLLLGACASPVVKLGSVSSLEQIDTSKGEKLTASASGFQLLLFIPIAVNGRQRNAYDNLLEQAGDRLLTDVKITESWTYAFIGTVYTTTIEATAYPKRTADVKQ